MRFGFRKFFGGVRIAEFLIEISMVFIISVTLCCLYSFGFWYGKFLQRQVIKFSNAFNICVVNFVFLITPKCINGLIVFASSNGVGAAAWFMKAFAIPLSSNCAGHNMAILLGTLGGPPVWEANLVLLISP